MTAGPRSIYLEEQVDIASDNRMQSWQYPTLPRAGSRFAAPVFDLLECRLDGKPSDDDMRAALEALERPRAGALTFWLRTMPPVPSQDQRASVRRLLDSDESLIEHLRGASFLTMSPVLPLQFDWTYIDGDLAEDCRSRVRARRSTRRTARAGRCG